MAESSSLWRLTLYLTALSVSLAACAFLLQWRGGLQDPDNYSFPEMGSSETNLSSTLSSADCAQILGRSKEPSFPYYSWRPASRSGPSHNPLKLCVATTTMAGLEEILPWIFYHKIIGITQFFLFVEGKAASNNVAIVLESIPEVKLIHRTFKDLEEHKARSRVWYETDMPHYLNKPCNYELYVKQSLNMEMAVGMAREAGMDWIFHIDTDELLHPAGTMSYSLQELLSEVPSNVDFVKFPNYESCVERDDIKEPFSEVTMFKKNYFHLCNESFYKYPDIRFLTYENWKSAARVQDGVLPLGAHEWYSYQKKRTNETMFEEAAILHYTYTKFSDLTSKAHRCRCKPTREDVERCFMMKFDRKAFIISSASTEEEMLYWYYEHVVWYDTKVNAELLREGVFERIYTPMMIVQGLKESGLFADVIASAWQKQASQKSSSQTAAGEPTGENKSQSALDQ